MEGDIAVQTAAAAVAEDEVEVTLVGLTDLASPGEVGGTMGTPDPVPVSMRTSSAW